MGRRRRRLQRAGHRHHRPSGYHARQSLPRKLQLARLRQGHHPLLRRYHHRLPPLAQRPPVLRLFLRLPPRTLRHAHAEHHRQPRRPVQLVARPHVGRQQRFYHGLQYQRRPDRTREQRPHPSRPHDHAFPLLASRRPDVEDGSRHLLLHFPHSLSGHRRRRLQQLHRPPHQRHGPLRRYFLSSSRQNHRAGSGR